MSPIKIYHNPKCSNSRHALALLREHGHEPEVVLYLDTPPTRQELQDIIQATGVSVRALIDVMLAHPVLMNRPIVVTHKGMRLC